MSRARVTQAEYFRGVRTAPYDLIKELVIALGAIGLLVLVASAAFSSPDVPSLTIQSWAQSDPVDFVTTATGELAGTTPSSQYGAPYNSGSNSVQSLGFFSPQQWFGARQPVDSANEFVLQPLIQAEVGNADLTSAMDTYKSASSSQQQSWLTNYSKALANGQFTNGTVTVADGDYGPVPTMMTSLLAVARTGGLDGMLLSSGHFYQTDYTRTLLFMGDGGYLANQAQQQSLMGNQWGMMNETGSYPGQTWLWLYTMWYQLPPFNSSSNADLLVVLTMTVLTVLLALVPFIPVLRDIPRWVPIYRLIWRTHYRESGPSPHQRPSTQPKIAT